LRQSNSRRWLITRAERVLSEDVPAPPDDVRAFYTDLDNIEAVHPLVVSVRVTARTELADGYHRSYRVKDRIPLGPLTVPTTYTAHLTVPTAGDVVTEARQFPGVRLYGVVSFDPVDAGTRVVERLTIEAPRPLAAITVREAVAAHTVMLAGIRRHFGG
jgi:Polyketide cyclase / dehydrase and lipid transport